MLNKRPDLIKIILNTCGLSFGISVQSFTKKQLEKILITIISLTNEIKNLKEQLNILIHNNKEKTDD